MNSRSLRAAIVLFAAGLALAQAPDTGSNSRLSGRYYVRMVAFSGVDGNGGIARARSLSGVMTFDGTGTWVFDGQVADNRTTPVLVAPFGGGGQYTVFSNGQVEIQNPFDRAQTIRAGLADAALLGSSTEGDMHDAFVAVPAAASGATVDAMGGTWRTAYFDFPDGKSTLARTGFFSMVADGRGNFADISLSGNGISMGVVNRTVSGASYWLNQNSSGGLRFPVSPGDLLSGEKIMYVSADRNTVIGGSANGFDLLVAVRATPAGTNAAFKGTYFMQGVRVEPFQLSSGVNHFYFYSGSVIADGQYYTIEHYRINPNGAPSYDLTLQGGFNLGPDGTMNTPGQLLALGGGGDAFILTSLPDSYNFMFAVRAKSEQRGRVWVDPVGIVNAASLAPATNPVAPGEIVWISGAGFADSDFAAGGAPLPMSLGGVQVLVNSRSAPVMYVSPTRILALVPYATREKFATFQVVRDGGPSNTVTMYNNLCSPGVFTASGLGVGPGAVLHADMTPVTPDNPARRGETITFFATGLGQVTPGVADGAAAPVQPASRVVLESTLYVFIGGRRAQTRFGGLLPGYAGIYRIDARIPEDAPVGDVLLDIDADPAGYTSLATLRIGQ